MEVIGALLDVNSFRLILGSGIEIQQRVAPISVIRVTAIAAVGHAQGIFSDRVSIL